MPVKKALLIIAPRGFQDVELAGTRNALVEAGFDVVLASTSIGLCVGKFGGSETATVAMRDVAVADYDRIAFIGGPGAAALVADDDAKRIARDATAEHMPLGAICIAPTILAAAGVLKGKRATCWDDGQGTQFGILEHAGAVVVRDQAVVTDGLLVTGNGPEAAEEFGRVLMGV